MFSPPKPSSPKSILEQLAAVPVRNEHIEKLEDSEADCWILAAEKNYSLLNDWMVDKMGLKKQTKFELQGLGLEVYKKINGKRTLLSLVEELMQLYMLSFFEARVCSSSLLMMSRQRWEQRA